MVLLVGPSQDRQHRPGVRFRYDGRTHEARATREIIVSAGAVAAPRLLALSGIGNPTCSRPWGIPAAHALRVALDGIYVSICADLAVELQLARHLTGWQGPRHSAPGRACVRPHAAARLQLAMHRCNTRVAHCCVRAARSSMPTSHCRARTTPWNSTASAGPQPQWSSTPEAALERATGGPPMGHMAQKRQSPLEAGFAKCLMALGIRWLRGQDLNLRPLGYETANHPCSPDGLYLARMVPRGVSHHLSL